MSSNLLDNAMKFSPEKGSVTVSAANSAERIAITFTNQVLQPAAIDVSHIFDKFYQAAPSRSTEGNGLGLPIAKKIIELHGGAVKAHFDPKALVFMITAEWPVSPE